MLFGVDRSVTLVPYVQNVKKAKEQNEKKGSDFFDGPPIRRTDLLEVKGHSLLLL